MKEIFSVLVGNHDGVLSQIVGLFARRGSNIDSLAVGETEQHGVSSVTIVSNSGSRASDQAGEHLNKKINVTRVRRFEESSSILKEMMLIKVAYSVTARASLIGPCSVTDAKVAHFSQKTMVIQLTVKPEVTLSFIGPV